jgi:hypothetical protein
MLTVSFAMQAINQKITMENFAKATMQQFAIALILFGSLGLGSKAADQHDQRMVYGFETVRIHR